MAKVLQSPHLSCIIPAVLFPGRIGLTGERIFFISIGPDIMATVAKKTHYELMIILKDSLSEKATKEALDAIRGHISDAKGTITFEDLWGTKTFVYPVKDFTQGYYAIFYFDLAKEQVAELKKELDLEQTILRKLMISLPATMNVKEFIEEEKKRTQAEEERLEAEREKKKAEAAKKSPARAPKPEGEATEAANTEESKA